MRAHEQLVLAIIEHRRKTGESFSALAARAGVPKRSLSSIVDGHVPSVDRAAEICAALGLEYYIGPPRAAGPAADPLDVPRFSDRPENGFSRVEESGLFVTPWPVRLRGVDAGWSPYGCAWFGADWLARFNLDPVLCETILVHDESMAPALVPGSVALVDRRRTRLRADRLYAIESGPGLLIRRAGRGGDRWLLKAAGPKWGPPLRQDEATLLGQVVWTARMVGAEKIDGE